MKFQLPAALLGLLASTVSAQEHNTTGPFYLHVTGNDNSSIDGYITSCHTGAAMEGLCYGTAAPPEGSGNYSWAYNFNTTGSTTVDDNQVGILTWDMPYTTGDNTTAYVSQAMALQFQANSNVAALQFGFGSYTAQVGFDGDGRLFSYSYIDDSTFAPGQQPDSSQGKTYYQWFVCWQYFTGYYYDSIGLAQTLPPQNPTCEAVTITKVDP